MQVLLAFFVNIYLCILHKPCRSNSTTETCSWFCIRGLCDAADARFSLSGTFAEPGRSKRFKPTLKNNQLSTALRRRSPLPTITCTVRRSPAPRNDRTSQPYVPASSGSARVNVSTLVTSWAAPSTARDDASVLTLTPPPPPRHVSAVIGRPSSDQRTKGPASSALQASGGASSNADDTWARHTNRMVAPSWTVSGASLADRSMRTIPAPAEGASRGVSASAGSGANESRCFF